MVWSNIISFHWYVCILWFLVPIYILIYINYCLSIRICIIYIIHDLDILGIIQKIQVMSSLQDDKLFIVGLWN